MHTDFTLFCAYLPIICCQKIVDKFPSRHYYIGVELATANYFFEIRLADANICKITAQRVKSMNLLSAMEGTEYIIQRIETDDEELDAFLFSLGCYSGEPITVIAHKKSGCTVSIKDGRYSIDKALAAAIII